MGRRVFKGKIELSSQKLKFSLIAEEAISIYDILAATERCRKLRGFSVLHVDFLLFDSRFLLAMFLGCVYFY